MSPLLVRTALKYGLARGLPGLVNLLALVLFTRVLSEAEYGLYALTFSAAVLGHAFALQWLSLALLRLLHIGRWSRPVFLATVLQVFAVVSVVAIVALALLTTQLVHGLPLSLLLVGAALLAGHSWFDLNLYLATADHDPGRYARLSVLKATTGLALGLIAALRGGGAIGVAAGAVGGYLAAGLVAAWWEWRPGLSARPEPALRRELLHYGLPLAAAFVLDYVVSTSDRLLLGALRSPADAGLYAPAYDMCQQALWALMMVVNLAAYPLAIRAVEEGDIVGRDRHFRQHFLLLAGLGLPAAAGLGVLAPGLSGLLGPRFAPAARDLLPIIAFAILLGGFKSYYFDLSFQLGRATRMQLVTVAVAALVNLGLNLRLIPTLGLQGAAWATLAAYSIGLGLSVVLGRRVLVLPIPWGDFFRVTLATAGMVLILLPLRNSAGSANLALQIGIGVAVYGGLVVALNPGRVRALLHT